jgi:hypothetical protein
VSARCQYQEEERRRRRRRRRSALRTVSTDPRGMEGLECKRVQVQVQVPQTPQACEIDLGTFPVGHYTN